MGSPTASRHGSLAATSRRSRATTVASMRSRISEAVRREVERSAYTDYLADLKGRKDRKIAAELTRSKHLQAKASPVDQGHPNLHPSSEAQDAARRPVAMAIDPKWSTDIKKDNDRVGLRIKYNQDLSASVPGSIVPELKHMRPQKHVSNPATPHFQPGVKEP